MTASVLAPGVPPGSDISQERASDLRVRPRARRARTRTLRVISVNIEVDMTDATWLIYISPRLEAQAMGIGHHRSRLPRCRCARFSGKANRCRWCRGFSDLGMARHVTRLLKSYPKISVKVPA